MNQHQKHRIYLLLSLFTLLISCATNKKSIDTLESSKFDPLLWEITYENKTSYIFGTIHTGIDANSLPEPVWRSFKSCKTLILETDVSSPNPHKILERGLYKSGETLDSKLNKEEWQKLVNLLGKDYPTHFLNKTKPYMAISMLLVKLAPKTEPMEATFTKRAMMSKKMDLAYLETFEFQISILESLMDIEVLKEMLKEPEKTREAIKKLVHFYKNGDINSLYQEIVAPSYGKTMASPEKLDTLIFARNRDWLSKIEPYLKKGRAFIAVGAGHLLKEKGLISLLQDRGFKAKKLP